jgi:hypothetical protein
VIENVLRAVCDRCKATKISTMEDEDAQDFPEWLTIRKVGYVVPEKHLCPRCKDDFDLFMENKEVLPKVFGFQFPEVANGVS